jgi:hypothetical protein
VVARGIIHCHTELSFDCRTPLERLREFLLLEGFQFVALTDHDRDVTPQQYRQFVQRCGELSDDKFLLLPGIEVKCTDGSEIAGIGLSQLPEAGAPESVVQRIRALGGYAVWVHPRKKVKTLGHVLECDAIEVLNGKLDGTLAPDLELVRFVQRERSRGRTFHAIFGLDMHDDLRRRCVWMECEAAELTTDVILEALRRGRFVNRTSWGSMESSGRADLADYLRFASIRRAHKAWNGLLRKLPERTRSVVVRASRPVLQLSRLRSR